MKNCFLLFILFTLSGCSSLFTGTTQPISVSTNVNGARCELANNEGIWVLATTPGSVSVKRSEGTLIVKCSHQIGLSGSAEVASYSTDRTSFLLGGLVGAVFDRETGAIYNYPSFIPITLK